MSRTFLLAGNGNFRNHGCEAIARGVIEILTHTFGSSIRIIYAGVECAEQEWMKDFDFQQVEFFPVFRKYSRPWAEYQINRYYGTSFMGGFAHLRHVISQADIVLCIGGDNYSLDYGYPERFVQFDRLVLKYRKPIAYFGVSVGPFSADQKYEQKIKSHLKRIDAICARESGTISYLSSIGVTQNVFSVADPAFVMKAVRPDPSRFVLNMQGFIGVNFSTTVGRILFDTQEISSSKNASFTSSGSMKASDAIVRHYAEIAATLMDFCDNNLMFIPHVTGGSHCDYVFMSKIADQLVTMGFKRPLLVPDNLTAPEYKWIISQAKLFIGARTHSTIAAFSSGVPTITLSYSIKARGLTQDMYGCDDYCIDGKEVNAERILNVAKRLLADEKCRNQLNLQAQKMTDRALFAGEIIKKLASEPITR